MVRAFTDAPVDPEVVDGLIDLARRAPSAGNSQGVAFVVLEGAEQTAPLLGRRAARPSGAATSACPGSSTAPVLIVALVRADTWVERYGEPDKAAHGLGAGEDAWPVPYWWVDGGMAVEHLLLGAVDAGLGRLLLRPVRPRARGVRRRSASPTAGAPSAPSRSATRRPTSPASRPAARAAPSTRSSTAAAGEPRPATVPAVAGRG